MPGPGIEPACQAGLLTTMYTTAPLSLVVDDDGNDDDGLIMYTCGSSPK